MEEKSYFHDNIKLLDYQQKVREKYLSSDRTSYGLFMDLGTGKTATSLSMALELYLSGKIDKVQIICPSGLRTNWIVEINKFIKPEFHELFLEPLGYPHLSRKKELNLTNRTLFILDEAHRIKNHQSKSTEYFFEKFADCYGALLLTGTPQTNSALDLYTPCKVLGYANQGVMQFINEHCVEKLMKRGKMHFYVYTPEVRNLEKLMNGIAPYSSWIKTEDVLDLPEQIHIDKFFSINKKQKALLDVAAGKIKEESISSKVPEVKILEKHLPAIQLLLDGLMPDSGKIKTISTDKIELLEELLEENPEEQYIILCLYHYEIDQIREVLEKAKISYVLRTGKSDKDEKDKAVTDFTSGSVRVLLGTVKANSEGLTLVNCRHMIYYSIDFDYLQYAQSLKRIHRIGQDKTCYYYYLRSVDIKDDKYKGLDSIVLDVLGVKGTSLSELFDKGS